MEIFKKKTSDYSSKALNKDLKECVDIANRVCKVSSFIITHGGEEVESIRLKKIDFSDLSKSARKKIKKRMRHVINKESRRSINMLFHYLKNRIGLDKIYVDKSKKEQEIDSLRKEYKELRAKTEEARVKFRESKKGFYV